MDGTITKVGNFTSDGTTKQIKIASDFDKIRVYNTSIMAAGGADTGAEFYWQRGMTNGKGFEYKKLAADDSLAVSELAAGTGFTLLDMAGNPLASSVAVTGTTNVVRPIVTASIAGMAAGDIVRLFSITGAESLSGYDFAIDTVAGGAFRIAGALATAPGAAGTAGSYRKINFDPLFYPRHRYIANISKAASAVITLTVPSGYKVGQKVRVIVPVEKRAGTSIYGMTGINGLTGTITAVDDTLATQTITLNIDSSGFDAFKFPLAADLQAQAVSKAMIVPIGMDTTQAISSSTNILSDATDNRGFIGVSLAAGTDSPAGVTGNKIYWEATKAFYVNNEI